jgi:hypothetical protein
MITLFQLCELCMPVNDDVERMLKKQKWPDLSSYPNTCRDSNPLSLKYDAEELINRLLRPEALCRTLGQVGITHDPLLRGSEFTSWCRGPS